MLGKEAANAMTGWNPFSKRIITVGLQSKDSFVTVVMSYESTEDTNDKEKDEFYQQCQNVLNTIPQRDIVLLMGDMNVQINGNRRGLERVIGPHGSAQATNYNGERLLLLCSINGLCIGNTYCAHNMIYKEIGRLLDGKLKNYVDYICISRRWRLALNDVKVCRGADV